LKWSKKLSFSKEVKHIFVQDSFQDLANDTKERYGAVIADMLGICFFADSTNMGDLPLPGNFTTSKGVRKILSGLAISITTYFST